MPISGRAHGRFRRPRRQVRGGLTQLLCALIGLALGLLLPRITVWETVASIRVADSLVGVEFLPMMIAENSMTAVKPVPHTLSPGLGLGLLCLYAAAALTAGGWALARRDP